MESLEARSRETQERTFCKWCDVLHAVYLHGPDVRDCLQAEYEA